MNRMKIFLKSISLFSTYRAHQDRKKYNLWLRNGRPLPVPHLVKQMAVRQYARKHELRTLVETGTFHGDMINAVKTEFDIMYSIELDMALFEKARLRFKRDGRVIILQGNSGEVLESLLSDLNAPCLFWLDSHYSGGYTARGNLDTPIYKELNLILPRAFGERRDVILIDDAREFTGEKDYPKIETLKALAVKHGFQKLDIKNDIIRIESSYEG